MGLLRMAASFVVFFYCILSCPAAKAQFKEIGPAPFSPAVAQQKIRTLLEKADQENRQQTIDSINALTPWFRNVLDEELIAGWKGGNRDRLTLVLEPLADTRVAVAVVEFSWRKRTDAVFNPGYASVLGSLMARYPESGSLFLSDLLAPAPPQLSPQEAETVCRILLDMPDIGTWHQSALRILPRYRSTAERLLSQDGQADDQEKRYRAQIWTAELGGQTPGFANQASISRKQSGSVNRAPDAGSGPVLYPPPPATPLPTQRVPQRQAAPLSYNGPMSGNLECTGSPIPQNAEYVFRNLPPFKLQLDYDQRIWEGRLAPGENQTQRLILKNKSSGPQKRCVVHWSILPGQ
jgi:hypothetical protein